ncbi:putative FAD-binding domain-containing protein [Seiridium cardinale]|uniref:FAD-binding domain-containing protein n=1 Tax=Seiridium cardinale TaxID=138064 RepID=A0ABR2XWU6_9PEZI
MAIGFSTATSTLCFMGITTFHHRSKWTRVTLNADSRDSTTRDHTTPGWPIWEMPHALTYFEGRQVLVDDAVHASPRFQGAGSYMAFEDTLVLECLPGRYSYPKQRSRSIFMKAQATVMIFQAYDAFRRFRTQKQINMSNETACIMCENEPGLSIRAADMRKRLAGRRRRLGLRP